MSGGGDDLMKRRRMGMDENDLLEDFSNLVEDDDHSGLCQRKCIDP
jgi:hypothetical protein